MRLKDVFVEVRNKNLDRIGVITHKWLDLKATRPHRGVGEWTLKLPRSHPMATELAKPGSGIVLSLYGAEKMSGPTIHPARETDRENPDGTYTFTGISDDVILADALAFPQPANANPATQTQANDVRQDDAESLMRAYVAYNISGTDAPAGRLGGFRDFLRLETVNQHRGPVLQKSPRFQNLGELLGEIAIGGNLGFQVIQRGEDLVFEVLTLKDRTDLVQLSVKNGSLTKESLEISPPSLTRAIVAGQGEGTERQMVQRSTPDSQAAEAQWGRIIERFIDQRNTDVVLELEQAGDEQLLEEGFTATSVKAIPADDQTMRYAIDWEVGDTVGLVVDGQEVSSVVTAAVILANSTGVAVGAAIGDVSGFDPQAALASRVDDTQRRVSSLERSVEIRNEGPAWSDIQNKPSIFPTNTTSVAGLSTALADTVEEARVPAGLMLMSPFLNPPDGWLACNGAILLKADFPDLFAAIGTTFNSGTVPADSFMVPDLRGRMPLGMASWEPSFDSMGEKGGTKEVVLTTEQIPNHAHAQYITANVGGGAVRNDYTSDSAGIAYPQGINTGYTGGGQAHTNMPPYFALNFVIKY